MRENDIRDPNLDWQREDGMCFVSEVNLRWLSQLISILSLHLPPLSHHHYHHHHHCDSPKAPGKSNWDLSPRARAWPSRAVSGNLILMTSPRFIRFFWVPNLFFSPWIMNLRFRLAVPKGSRQGRREQERAWIKDMGRTSDLDKGRNHLIC